METTIQTEEEEANQMVIDRIEVEAPTLRPMKIIIEETEEIE